MRTHLTTMAMLFLALQPTWAINENAGTTAFNFLKIGVGARAAALGGAFAAVSGDPEAVAWNPAGLWGLSRRTAVLSLNNYLIDTQAGFLSLTRPGAQRVWAVSANYVTYGDLQETDEQGQLLGTFGAADLAVSLSAASRLWKSWLSAGLSLKAIYSSIGEFSSDAYVLDLGLQAQGPLQGMTLGASLSNLGLVRSGYSGDFKDSLPVHIRLGLAHRPAHMPLPMLVLADLNVPNDNDAYLSFGLEMHLPGGLYLRPGYSTQQTGLEGQDPLGLTAGAGFALTRYRLDYAFTSYPDLGEVHRVSLAGAF
jgi:hypothetical protein